MFAGLLKVVAEPSRLRILALLTRAGQDGLPFFDLQKELGLSQATVTYHLVLLAECGLVSREMRDRRLINILNVQAVQRLAADLGSLGKPSEQKPRNSS